MSVIGRKARRKETNNTGYRRPDNIKIDFRVMESGGGLT
jgi:hypothetical protein